ncbi:MAG: HAMP domain-containing methyl-accepting chemotaxis protein [bacterium]
MEMFKNLKTGQKITCLVVTMLIFIGFLGFIALNLLNRSDSEYDDMYNGVALPLKQINQIRTLASENEALILRLILSKDKTEFARVSAESTETDKITDETFQELFKSGITEDEKVTAKTINDNQDNIATACKEIADLASNGQKRAAYQKYLDIVASIDKLDADLKAFSDKQEKDAALMKKQQDVETIDTRLQIYVILIICLVAGLTLGLFIANMISKPLASVVKLIKEVAKGNLLVNSLEYTSQDEIGDLAENCNLMTNNLRKLVQQVATSATNILSGSEEMSSAADQTAMGAQHVAENIQQLAHGAQDVSISVEGSANNLNQMNKVVQTISLEAHSVAHLSNETEMSANIGKDHVKKAVDKIESIRSVSSEISGTIGELGKLSSEIETIVDLIKSIAGQTNLLALNAAIEAARAGEHGKGFAVVADEVKQLAGASVEATNKITAMIKEIQLKTNLAVSSMDKGLIEVNEGVIVINDAGSALENIIDQVKLANLKIQGINKEIDGVAKSSDEIVASVESIASVTEQTSASAQEIAGITEEQTASLEEINANSQSLASIAETLKQQVAVFRV